MRGKVVDMDLLRKRNELTPAVGNARVNARGDELGPGGQIVKKREDVVAEHYKVAGSVADSSGRTKTAVQEEAEVAPVVEQEPVKKTVTRTTKKADSPAEVAAEEAALDEEEEWIEDEDGNFVKKGE